MEIRFSKKEAGSYNIVTAKGGIVVGRIVNVGGRYPWYTKTNDPGIDTSLRTLRFAKATAKNFFKDRDFCVNGCGSVVWVKDRYCQHCRELDLSGVYWDKANKFRVRATKVNDQTYSMLDNLGFEESNGYPEYKISVRDVQSHIQHGVLTPLVGTDVVNL